MMSDIFERLMAKGYVPPPRDPADYGCWVGKDLLLDAAHEIERLRHLLRSTAVLAYSLADDESGIDDNETYKAAIAASHPPT